MWSRPFTLIMSSFSFKKMDKVDLFTAEKNKKSTEFEKKNSAKSKKNSRKIEKKTSRILAQNSKS